MNSFLNILTFDWLIPEEQAWLGALVPVFWVSVLLFLCCLTHKSETQTCYRCSQEFPESTMCCWKTTYKQMWICKGCWKDVTLSPRRLTNGDTAGCGETHGSHRQHPAFTGPQ